MRLPSRNVAHKEWKNIYMLMSLINIIAGLFLMVARAFVLSKMWAWFIVSQFITVPHLPYGTAMGISLIVGLLSSSRYYSLEEINKMKLVSSGDRSEALLWNTFIQIIAVVSIFITAWVLHLFM
mgnify:CR=1 FL=1